VAVGIAYAQTLVGTQGAARLAASVSPGSINSIKGPTVGFFIYAILSPVGICSRIVFFPFASTTGFAFVIRGAGPLDRTPQQAYGANHLGEVLVAVVRIRRGSGWLLDRLHLGNFR
jgi:hypothetical protein